MRQFRCFVALPLLWPVVAAAETRVIHTDPLDPMPRSLVDSRLPGPVLIAAVETTPPPSEPLPPPDIDDPGPAAAPLGTAGADQRVTLEASEPGAGEKVLPREGGTTTDPDLPKPIASEEPLPEKVRPPADDLPDVTIRTEGETRVEEYRRNGQVYMVRFVPTVGVPYTYLDTDGDGRLEGEPGEGIKPVYYTLYEWE